MNLKSLVEVDVEEILTLKPRELKKLKISDYQARGLVKTYYDLQDYRIISASRHRKLTEEEQPHAFAAFLTAEMLHLEKMIQTALDGYSNSQEIGRWARSICGIGPVISSGLMAYINIEECPVASHLWRYAGLDPTTKWLGADKAKEYFETVVGKRGPADQEQLIKLAAMNNLNAERFIKANADLSRAEQIANYSKRPWNATLKVLCWKIGQSFVKVSSNDKDVYGKIYQIRKAYEQQKNENGEYAAQAAQKLKDFNIGKETDAYKAYVEGKLPPAHIQQRAERYATKIFLSHYHAVAYELHYGVKPPKPFAIAILNHAHEIPVPNWPMEAK